MDMDNEDIFNLTDIFEQNQNDEKTKVERVSLDMWGEKSFTSHKHSMAVNKFLKPFRTSLFKIIIETLYSNQIDIMVYAGTALAVWRDGGNMIPHDHDIDLAISESDFIKVLKSLNERIDIFTDTTCPFTNNKWINDDCSDQVLYNQAGVKRIKVYFNELYLRKMSERDGKFKKLLNNYDRTKLFVDIFTFQKKVDTNFFRVTWNIRGVYDNDKKCFPEDTIFPLKEYKFEGISVLGPNNIENYLSIEYGYLGKDARYDCDTQLYVKLSEQEIKILPRNIKSYMTQ